MNKKALITGITGQDGSYLAESLLRDGYEVYGIVRRNSSGNLNRISHILHDLRLYDGDITDLSSLLTIFSEIRPDEIYNLAAQSHVGISYKIPDTTLQITGIGAINVMEAAWRIVPNARVYQASSSEMFGEVIEVPQKETTPFNPISPYAAAKVLAHHMAKIYRKQGLFVACGICFNHESERRGQNFVTMKVLKAASEGKKITLGNLSAVRDWGYAPEFVEGFRMILHHNEPDDFVLGTGEAHSVEEFVKASYSFYGLDWNEYVSIDQELFRPIECGPLKADYSKAHTILGWKPEITFERLIEKIAPK